MHAITKNENGTWMAWDPTTKTYVPMSPEEIARLKAIAETANRMFPKPKPQEAE